MATSGGELRHFGDEQLNIPSSRYFIDRGMTVCIVRTQGVIRSS
jgi:hypothetical protein